MKGVPQGRYTKEFREEAVKLVTEARGDVEFALKRHINYEAKMRIHSRFIL